MELNDILKNSLTITLWRRPERAVAFSRGYMAATGRPARFVYGFDGSKVPTPHGWKSSPGAFGCCLAHAVALARALSDYGLGEDDPIAIFEDDCVFVPDFATKLSRAAKLVPSDWDLFYLGGQHLVELGGKPRVVAQDGDVSIARSLNINRLHAYVVRVRAARVLFPRLLEYATNAPERIGKWNETPHDFEMGRLMQAGILTAYAVSPWLCGQDALGSDTFPSSDASRVRYWNQ